MRGAPRHSSPASPPGDGQPLEAGILQQRGNRVLAHRLPSSAIGNELISPWQSLGAFLRIATHPRAFQQPLPAATAWDRVSDWLSAPVAWIPEPGPLHARILGELLTTYEVRGNLVPDALLAALAIEHGLTLYSTDTDFARFGELHWENPLAG
ncbi:MAG: PIN domain-containing protein [Solirubrobacterales bacterium]|nr:PIN domain-containing protein [Solirubrobacterales bacterium]